MNLAFLEAEHKYLVDDREAIGTTSLLRAVGLSPDYSGISPKYRHRGTAVHKARHLIDAGVDVNEKNTHAEILGYADQYRSFLSDTGFKAMASEIALIDPAIMVGGTLDIVGLVQGEVWLVDVKTGTVHSSVGIQLCGYESLLWDGEFINPERDAGAIEWLKLAGLCKNTKKRCEVKRRSLNLTGSGPYKLRACDDYGEMADWKAAVRIYHRRKRDGMLNG